MESIGNALLSLTALAIEHAFVLTVKAVVLGMRTYRRTRRREEGMKTEDTAKMTELMAKCSRLRRKGKNVEPVVEELNKLASRRAPRYRFTVQNDPRLGLVVRVAHPEQLPHGVAHGATTIFRVDERGKTVEQVKPTVAEEVAANG